MSNQILWDSWERYPKVLRGGNTYASIGGRLYSRHAVDRMQPSGLGAAAGMTGTGGGRSISPNLVEQVLQRGMKTTTTVKGEVREVWVAGSTEVVTTQGAQIVISINPFKHG